MDSSPAPFAPLGDDGDPKTPCCPANDAAETGEDRFEDAPAALANVPAMDLNVSTSNVRVVGSSLDS